MTYAYYSTMEPRPVVSLTSDREDAALVEQERENAAQHILTQVGHLLDDAEFALDDLERRDMLGTAIQRGCQDLADAVGHLATQLENQSDAERRALAQACLEDVQSLQLDEEEDGAIDVARSSSWESLNRGQLDDITNLTENDMMKVISAAGSLLRDVEGSFRAIEQDEADELADAAITLARLFLASLESIYSQLRPEDLMGQPTTQNRSTVEIELLDEDDDETDNDGENKKERSKPRHKKPQGVRVLWPPLGPAVADALNWSKEEAAKKPLLAVALGITLWPAAVATAFVGTPVVIADGFVQDLYNNFQDGPIVQGMERSAAQLYHTGRLSLIMGKLTARQTLRVVQRQVDRHGGIGQIAQNVGDWSLHRLTHPVETFGMAWDGLCWGIGTIRDAVGDWTDEERESTVQDLQSS